MFHEQPRIIEGQLVNRKDLERDQTFEKIGVTVLVKWKVAQVRLANRTILLRTVKIIVRVSGRQAHLSRYLSGVCVESGEQWQIFLGVVAGIGDWFFQRCLDLRRYLGKLLLADLSPFQQIYVLLQRT
jgi:hypothetical protein